MIKMNLDPNDKRYKDGSLINGPEPRGSQGGVSYLFGGKDEPDFKGDKSNDWLYTPRQWELLQKLIQAMSYNLGILRGKTRAVHKGTIQARQDYDKAKKKYMAFINGDVPGNDKDALDGIIDVDALLVQKGDLESIF